MPDTGPSDDDNRVVSLRQGALKRGRFFGGPKPADEGDGLKKFAQPPEDDDYRERMITNVIALGFLAFLIVAGVWIANTMASIRKNQDCVLSGRRGCTPVDAPPAARW
jgi:hypothetical protein